MWSSNTMTLSNHLTSNLMSNFFTDRKHVRCYLSLLMEMDLPFIHFFISGFHVKGTKSLFFSLKWYVFKIIYYSIYRKIARLVLCLEKLSWTATLSIIICHLKHKEKLLICIPAHNVLYCLFFNCCNSPVVSIVSIGPSCLQK